MINNIKKSIFLLFLLVFVGITNVSASTKNIEVTNIEVKEKSGTITVVDPVFESNEVKSNATFNKKDDFVTFELTLKNNESEKYKITSITDNNTNENIQVEYSFSKDFINTGDTSKVTLKLTYKNKLLNVDEITLNDLTITFNLESEEGKEEEIIINPVTGDNIFHYLVLLIIALVGIGLVVAKKKVKGIKVGSFFVVLAVLLLPFAVFANEKYEIKVKFNDIVIKGEYETYNISIDPGNGAPVETRQITYGDKIGTLPANPSKDGYTFNKWVDEEGNEVTEDTVITGPIEIIATYNLVTYNITYDLDEGSLPSGKSNPDKYTIESQSITLNNPEKRGYTFAGWSGTGIDGQTTEVTINHGSKGDRSYKAHYLAKDDTKYTVIHKFQKLSDGYDEETVEEHGTTGSTVPAPRKTRTGFITPAVQNVTIEADESASVTYVYDRETYAFSITDRTYVDSTSTADGTYPYGTEISVKAIERPGYDFKWSDGDTNLERTFTLENEKELTPEYTAKTNTPYVVNHYKMDIDGEHYTIADVQNLSGTTDSPISPAVNTYEGFTSPAVQITTINGDESTVVDYYYTRNQVTVTFTNTEYIEEEVTTGPRYYGEQITLTAKTIEGKTFVKWSNDETDNPITITVGEEDIEIGPIYTGNQLTVSFDTDGGSEVASQTINYGEKAIRPATDPTKTGYTFVDWYKDSELTIVFNFNTPITEDTTIYAKWKKEQFPEVFSESGECTFNGSSGVLTGNDCSYADGVNKYIDTGINLYNTENHDKDYEIGFTIVSYNPTGQERQATFMNTKLEGQNYPGVVIRQKINSNDFELSSRRTSTTNIYKYYDYSNIESIKIFRIYNEDKDAQEIYIQINDGNKTLINDLSSFNPIYDLSVWFGAAPTNASATTAQRILDNTTLSNMYIKLGTYQEDTNKYTVTLNANGGSVNPTSITVNNGDSVGTLPIPTPPTNKTFDGWYTELTGGVKVTSSYVPNSNITIFARYKNPTYTISFDAGEGSAVNDIEVEQGDSIGTLPTSTRNGYILEGWYEENTYETKVTSSTIPTGNVTYYAKWEELKVCADNENITRLSENTCSNNENITVGDGIVCKRAVKLHEETCSQTDTSAYCSGAGYTESGSKGTSTITYGSCGTSGTLTSGDAFTCDVNGDEKFDELTERFYYVSDYYDTSAKEFDTSTAVLIYYNNVTSGVSCNKNTFAYSTQADIQAVDPSRTSYDNWHGPLTVMKQLPTTSQWSNVSLKSDKRAILAENQSTHDSPTTNGGTLPTDFSYEGYAARLLTAKELMAGCNLTEVGRRTTGELDNCNYIMENTKYAKSSTGSYGPWLETPYTSNSDNVWGVGGSNRYVNDFNASGTSSRGARPTIEVPKSKISY